MTTITRTVITVEVTPPMRAAKTFPLHEAMLDGDENLAVGDRVFLYDGDVTYLSAEITGHEADVWQVTLHRD